MGFISRVFELLKVTKVSVLAQLLYTTFGILKGEHLQVKRLQKNDWNKPLTEDLVLHISLDGCVEHTFEVSISKINF